MRNRGIQSVSLGQKTRVVFKQKRNTIGTAWDASKGSCFIAGAVAGK
jgi:hypothetical protein